MKSQYRGRDCLKGGGGLGQFADLRGAWQESGGGVFEGGWYPNAHYDIDMRYFAWSKLFEISSQ